MVDLATLYFLASCSFSFAGHIACMPCESLQMIYASVVVGSFVVALVMSGEHIISFWLLILVFCYLCLLLDLCKV